MITLNAPDGKVLCDGYSKTSVGGKVFLPDTADQTVWVEMTEVEADALIASNSDEDATEEDYIAALGEMGVHPNEEA